MPAFPPRPRAPADPARHAALLALVAGCASPSAPPPALLGVAPDLACDAGAAVPITVTGASFAPAAVGVLADASLALPTLRLTRAGDATGADDGVSADPLLLSPEQGTLRWDSAGALSFDASPAIGLVAGAWDLEVVNPDGQSDTRADGFVWAAPPALVELAPAQVCVDSPAAPLTLIGTGFLVYGGVGPTVTVNGGDPLPVTLGECLPLAGNRDGAICTSLAVTVDATTLPLGDVTLSLTNPAPAACALPAPATFTVALPPTITTIEPGITCSDAGALRIVGERLPTDATVTVGGVPVASVTVIDASTLEIVVGEGTPDGEVEVVVTGSDGCAAVGTVVIVGEPDVFFVDPPAVYAGLTVEVTAWLADLSAEVVEVWIADDAGVRTDLSFVWDAADPNEVRATVPAGLAAGSYSFGFAEADGCDAELEDALTVTDTLTVAVDHLDPGHAWAYDHTSVQVIGRAPGSGEVGFVATPRLYVTPAGGAGGGVASAITGVGFRDETHLTATVPPGLASGAYDVLVVNPDHTVGLLEAGLVVTEERPPTITTVTPPGLVSNADETIHITGSSFRDPAVTLTCRAGGVETSWTATVLAASSTGVDALVPATGLGEAVCVVEVENDDGTRAKWAALSVRNPAENLFAWSAGTEMVVPRRAPVGAAGRTTSVARWVYAIGGDDGDAAGATTSVERAAIGVYGELGEWEVLPTTLPAPVTLAAGAAVGEFLYVVGGNDGVGPVASAWRAHILDPMDVPRFDALSIDDNGTLEGGEWTWRVAALYDAADVTNPGGESLPSDPITVSLPDTGGLSVEITWEAVDRAVGYRVYRSAAADTSGAEEWVGDTTAPSFRDDGLPTDSASVPLPEGALGAWAALPALLQAREAACVAVAPDPIPDPQIVYLYAAGGLAPDGAPLDTVEVLDVTVVRDDEHAAGEWRDAGVTLAEARWGCGAWAVDASRHSVVALDETWMYFGGGETPSRTVGTVDAGRVGPGGALEDWGEIDSMSPARSGFAVLSASDFLYGFGGQGGGPSTGGVSAELGSEPMPEVRNWNSLGVSSTVARHLAGSASESAVVVLVGGATDIEAATRSTDVTNW